MRRRKFCFNEKIWSLPTNKKYHLPGFTILELTVAMILTGLVVTIAYAGYGIMSRQYAAYQKTTEKQATLSLLDNTLHHDFAGAETIRALGNRLFFTETTGQVITYETRYNQIIRTQGTVTDTTNLDIVGWTTTQLPGTDLVEALRFETLQGEAAYPFSFRKHYGKEFLIRFGKEETS